MAIPLSKPARAIPPARQRFLAISFDIANAETPSFSFAEMLDLLDELSPEDFSRAVENPPDVAFDDYWSNYLAATIEQAASRKGIAPPSWVAAIPPLAQPVFGSTLMSLRLHLLIHSPAAFCSRNIFIDAAVGARV